MSSPTVPAPPSSLPEKRYLLCKPEQLQEYLDDRRKNYPSKANLERLQNEKKAKEHARVLLDHTDPSGARTQYEQVSKKGKIVTQAKPIKDITLVDKILYHEHRKMDSWILECAQFIQEENFLRGPIPKKYFYDYTEKEVIYEFIAPPPPKKTYYTSSSDISSSE
ncbi:hypothetical protein SS50377_20934 [Spironucleus salmonicida]|uniref:FMR1-interacting protein 1 conserved domain-containing protein n=1 Tax=Spironucleus salmonicida TaxID=348837 RepID=V6LGF4_9EUKA|nr:hypothetical protein SS50377_20934 [Spironucleus salmonicida]|eukprot:EST43607.1 hypothetical protein SS50377_16649 [Spironucleus salmonicida]